MYEVWKSQGNDIPVREMADLHLLHTIHEEGGTPVEGEVRV